MSNPSAENEPSRSVDPPARIAILGAGPLGVEAALYARYLGYNVVVLERDGVAANLRRWGHIRLSTPFAKNSSSLGLAALAAQDPNFTCPAADALITGNEWADRYIIPLSRTDLLSDHIRIGTTAVAVRKQPAGVEHETPAHDASSSQFQVLVRDTQGHESVEDADIVIDATGVFGHADGCRVDGEPVQGEPELGELIEYEIPDALGADREKYDSHRTLVVGDTIWATITLIGLSNLIGESPASRVTWMTEHPRETSTGQAADHRLTDTPPDRRRLPHTASRLVCEATPNMHYLPDTTIQSLAYDAVTQQFLVVTSHDPDAERFDQVVVNTGYHRDTSLFGDLWPDLRQSSDSADETDEEIEAFSDIPDATAPVEPNFYVLGAKSYGRDSRFLFAQGLTQIRQLFAIIGGRADLNLYATASTDPD